jgi:predicted DNA-binding transcriptional regulator AlpA
MDDSKIPPNTQSPRSGHNRGDASLNLDPILRTRLILADLDIDDSTLADWIKRGDFPMPLVLNPGQRREIVGWLTSVYRQSKADRPQRLAAPITANAYSGAARAKRRCTVAEKRAASERPAEPGLTQLCSKTGRLPNPRPPTRPHRASRGHARERDSN